MVHDLIFIVLGLGLVLAGANYLTDGASAIAHRFKISDLIIGITIVAFGSSTPDLVVSLTSTFQDKAAIAVGNIVGANIFDILFVVGLCAIIRPVVIGKATLQKEFPLVVLSSAVLMFLACDTVFDHAPFDFLDRSDGLVLLCFFVINCYVTYKISKSPDTVSQSAGNTTVKPSTIKMPVAALMVLLSLGALVLGGNWFVSSASGLAEHFGMSQSLVGLTIVAVGSSLPDLTTSVVAAIKGHSAIAIGNVVGSCILNVFFIIGLCSSLHPLDLGTINWIDFAVLTGGSVLLWIFGWMWGKRTINRIEGVVLVLLYVAYISYLVLSSK